MPATKKKNAAKAAPIATTANRKRSSDRGGLRKRSMRGVCASGGPACVEPALSPDVDAAVRRVPVDVGERASAQLEFVERGNVGLELRDAADADERRGDPR